MLVRAAQPRRARWQPVGHQSKRRSALSPSTRQAPASTRSPVRPCRCWHLWWCPQHDGATFRHPRRRVRTVLQARQKRGQGQAGGRRVGRQQRRQRDVGARRKGQVLANRALQLARDPARHACRLRRVPEQPAADLRAPRRRVTARPRSPAAWPDAPTAVAARAVPGQARQPRRTAGLTTCPASAPPCTSPYCRVEAGNPPPPASCSGAHAAPTRRAPRAWRQPAVHVAPQMPSAGLESNPCCLTGSCIGGGASVLCGATWAWRQPAAQAASQRPSAGPGSHA